MVGSCSFGYASDALSGESLPYGKRCLAPSPTSISFTILSHSTMDKFAPASEDRSRSGTPANSRFTTQAATAEDLLKEQTVGLVNLNDFRKRRAEALERKEREGSNAASGATTPRDG
jgi:hypothetical protein